MKPEQYSNQYKYKQIVKAKLFIDKNFAEKIDLHQIAIQAHFSKFHFIRLFKNIYGVTPNQYLTSVRIDRSQSLLKKKHTIDHVCFSVGFESVSTFKGLFKKETGTTPAAFKKHQLGVLASMKNNPAAHIPRCFTKMAVSKK